MAEYRRCRLLGLSEKHFGHCYLVYSSCVVKSNQDLKQKIWLRQKKKKALGLDSALLQQGGLFCFVLPFGAFGKQHQMGLFSNPQNNVFHFLRQRKKKGLRSTGSGDGVVLSVYVGGVSRRCHSSRPCMFAQAPDDMDRVRKRYLVVANHNYGLIWRSES